MADQHDTQSGRVRITTRIKPNDMDEIERLAAVRRTNVAQVARCLIEDALHSLGQHAAA